jgi:hypothetical protein
VVLGGRAGPSTAALSDLWEYAPVHPAGWTAFGRGCPGSAGVPTLADAHGPWLGEAYVLELRGLPPQAAAFVLAGASNTMLGALPLPLALAALGMPGCTLFTSIELAAGVTAGAAGTATWRVVLPHDAGLLAAPVYHQALVVDPAANLLGATTTNAAAARIGAK